MLPKLYDGTGQAPPEQIALRAGKLSVLFENGMLRYLRLGDHEILRGVYAAIRDHNWGTILGRLSINTLDVRPDAFDLRFTSDHQQGDIHFVWQGIITGTSDSKLRFEFAGESLTTFRRNRIGFCVLHPMTLAGARCTVEHVDGMQSESLFPDAIAPHQPLYDIRAIAHEVSPDVSAEVRMEGDTFEMEDQRNWTDASYKTYCTPLALPFPVEIAKGTKIEQTVTVRLTGQPAEIRVSESGAVLRLNMDSAHVLPPIGLARSSVVQSLSTREIERLKVLQLAHLRHDVRFDQPVKDALLKAVEETRVLGCKLELALHLGDNAEAQLRQVQSLVADAPVARWLILQRGAKSTPPELIALARRILDGNASIGAGTSGYFTQVNRERPPAELIDVLVYALNPQVHAFDNASLVETLPTQRKTVESARTFAGKAHIAVSPVTLKIGWNPDAPAPAETTPGTLPRQVDPRQMSLFGAAWTLGSLKWLSTADSITYYETVGWLGVMERSEGVPVPDLFSSVAGGVFPMYHVFADVGAFVGGQALDCISAGPLRFDGLALRHGDTLRVLVANYTGERQTITLTGISGLFAARALDETSADAAIRMPDAFRVSPSQTLEATDGSLDLELLPYAVLCLDQV